APGFMILSFSVVPAGEKRAVSTKAIHNMVPETEHSTHYFMRTWRYFAQDDANVTAALQASAEQAFLNEDKPILEKQSVNMGGVDFWKLKPVLLSVDAAAVRVRRKLDGMIAADQSGPDHPDTVQ
ncbi:MAG: aromatic ring-hydroxylating dioxygenase subunit alpha, partial [Sphingomonadaceae bacterium]